MYGFHVLTPQGSQKEGRKEGRKEKSFSSSRRVKKEQDGENFFLHPSVSCSGNMRNTIQDTREMRKRKRERETCRLIFINSSQFVEKQNYTIRGIARSRTKNNIFGKSKLKSRRPLKSITVICSLKLMATNQYNTKRNNYFCFIIDAVDFNSALSKRRLVFS